MDPHETVKGSSIEMKTSTTSGVALTGFSTGYGDKLIIEHLTCALEPGKFHVVCGPNGCGKSTLLRSIARLNEIKTGSITLDGTDITSIPRKTYAQKVAFLPQTPLAPAGITVRELVLRGRFPYRSSFSGYSQHDKEVVDKTLSLTNLTELSDRDITDLSGGQRQRAWIAMAIAQDADVLLLDEPTTYLDLTYQLEVLDLLKKLNQEHGMTIIAVLHDLMMCSRYAENLLVFKQGKLVTSGSPDEVFTRETLQRVFSVDAHIERDPVTNTPLIIPKGVNREG